MLNAMPTLLVLAVFLFSGLTVQAQVFTAENDGVATISVDQNGKTVIQYMNVTNAIATLRSEIGIIYPVPVADDNSAVSAKQVYGRLMYERAAFYIGDTGNVADSIHKAWNEVRSVANGKWPDLITQTDYDDMVTLLSL